VHASASPATDGAAGAGVASEERDASASESGARGRRASPPSELVPFVAIRRLARPLCLAARRDDEAWQWQERLGHLHFEALKRLSAKGMVRGLPCLDHVK
jgi:hypothetical protein